MDDSVILQIFKSLHLLFCSIGFVFNTLLMFLAIFKTPQIFRSYSILIANFAITDLFICVMDYFLQQRMVPIGYSVAFFSAGPCRKFGYKTCEISFAIMLGLIAHSLWSLLISFYYRLHILSNPAPTIRQLISILLIFCIPTIIPMILATTGYTDPQYIRAIVSEHFPSYNTIDQAVTGVENILEFPAICPVLYMTLPITPVYITIIIIRKEIINRLDSRGINVVTRRTKNIHLQLLLVLTYQSFLPAVYAIGVGSYLIGQLGIWNSPILEYLTFTAFIILPLLSPICSFVFIAPYRKYLCAIFAFRWCHKIEPSSIFSLNASIM